MNRQQFFENIWNKIENGKPVTVEIVGDISKILWKENGEYFLAADGKKKRVSREHARAEVHSMVARLIDERRFRGKE